MEGQREKRMRLFVTLMSFFGGLIFYAPVSLLVRTEAGLTLSEFFAVEIALSATILIFEIPAGMISDKIGYKNAIALSGGLLLIARVILFFAEGVPMFIVERVVEGVAYALLSGSEQAYIYSFFKEEEYALFSSRTGRAGSIGFILSTVGCGAVLDLWGVKSLIALTCVSSLFAFLSAVALPRERKTGAERREKPRGARSLPKTERVGVIPKGSLPLLFVLGGISAAYLTVNFFYAVKNQRMGMEHGFLSFIILGYSAIELVSPFIIKRIKTVDYPKWVLTTVLISAVGFGAVFLTDSLWCLPLLLLIPLALNIMTYLTDELINVSIDRSGLDTRRATVLSVFNMGSNVLDILFLVISAALASDEGNIAFLFASVYMAIVGAICLWKWVLAKNARKKCSKKIKKF